MCIEVYKTKTTHRVLIHGTRPRFKLELKIVSNIIHGYYSF